MLNTISGDYVDLTPYLNSLSIEELLVDSLNNLFGVNKEHDTIYLFEPLTNLELVVKESFKIPIYTSYRDSYSGIFNDRVYFSVAHEPIEDSRNYSIFVFDSQKKNFT